MMVAGASFSRNIPTVERALSVVEYFTPTVEGCF